MNTKFRFFICLSVILVVLCGCDKDDPRPPPEPTFYTNPLLKNEELVWDPAVIFDGTSYYAYSTEENWRNNTRPEMGIFKSPDMITWEFVGEVTAKNDAIWQRGVDAFKFNGKFYIYVLTDVSGAVSINVYESTKAGSGFTLKGAVKFPTSLEFTTDSYVSFFIDGSKQYAVTHGTVNAVKGVYIVEMTDVLNFKTGTEPKLLNDWEHDVHVGLTLQNPTIIKKDDSYYLIAKNDGIWSPGDIKVLKSSAVTGPYKDSAGGKDGNTMLTSADGKQVNGISSMFKDENGDFWTYYSVVAGWDARLYLDKVLWDANGFPYIKDRKPSTAKDLPGPAIYVVK